MNFVGRRIRTNSWRMWGLTIGFGKLTSIKLELGKFACMVGVVWVSKKES